MELGPARIGNAATTLNQEWPGAVHSGDCKSDGNRQRPWHPLWNTLDRRPDNAGISFSDPTQASQLSG